MAASQEAIAAFIGEVIRTADLSTLSMKSIRKRLQAEKGWEAGEHYEKEWFGAKVQELMAAHMEANQAAVAEAQAKADAAAGEEAAAAALPMLRKVPSLACNQ